MRKSSIDLGEINIAVLRFMGDTELLCLGLVLWQWAVECDRRGARRV